MEETVVQALFTKALVTLGSADVCEYFMDAMFSEAEREKITVRWRLFITLAGADERMTKRGLSAHAGVTQATASRARDAFDKHESFLRDLIERIADGKL